MAYIAPNSDVYLLRGVPLDSDYQNSFNATSADEQYSAFLSYRKYTLSDYSYQRAGAGKIRCGILCDNLYDCNYMLFRNTNFGSKWFYAFITGIEYLNNGATEITYVIDVMQTYFFDFTFGSCFVEREHSLTDGIGDNLVPEDIDTGELIPQGQWSFTYPDSISLGGIMYELVVFYAPAQKYVSGFDGENYTTADLQPSQKGIIVNGVYMGCLCYGIPMVLGSSVNDTLEDINKLVNTLASINASIVNIVQIPFNLWTDWLINGGSTATRASTGNMRKKNYNANRTAFYTAKNNKIYTYPFKSLLVSNNAGQTGTYKWEYFKTSGTTKQASFNISGVPVPTPEIMCYPTNYRGITNDYESCLVLNDFPQPAWSADSFTTWWRENKTSYITSLLSTALSSLGAVMSGNAVAIGANVASLINNSVGSFISAKNAPPQISGQAGISSLRTVQNRIGFTFYDMGLEMDKAKVVDNYFSLYGYAVKQLKKPNLKSGATLRPHWNYLKTQLCILHAATGTGLNAEYENKLCDIFNRGVTFWNSLAEVGDYSLDNSPS